MIVRTSQKKHYLAYRNMVPIRCYSSPSLSFTTPFPSPPKYIHDFLNSPAPYSKKADIRDKIEPFWDKVYGIAEGFQLLIAALGLSISGWIGFKSPPFVAVMLIIGFLYLCISKPPEHEEEWVVRSSKIKFYNLTRIWSGFLSATMLFGFIFSFVYPEAGGPGVYIATIAPPCAVMLYLSAKYQSQENPDYQRKRD